MHYRWTHAIACTSDQAGTHWWQAQSGLELGESPVVDLICTETEALCPAVKAAHELHLLCDAIPHNRHLAMCQLVHLPHMVLQNLHVAREFLMQI